MNRTGKRSLSLGVLAHVCVLISLCLMASCAGAARPADPARPRADEPSYPLVLEESSERRQRALAAWSAVVGEQAATTSPTPELVPVVATIKALPASSASPRLSRVFTEGQQEQSDEELRESLRRFIESAAPLLGLERRPSNAPGETERESTLGDLALVDFASTQDGAKKATFVHSPFDLPIRNGYGIVEVGFTRDLRVTALSSTAIPDTDRLRRLISTLRQGLTQDKVTASLVKRSFTVLDPSGAQQTRTVGVESDVAIRDLVVFPRAFAGDGSKIEIRLAWEVAFGDESSSPIFYVDAITGEQLT